MTDDEIAKHAVKHAVAHSRDDRTHRWLMVTRVCMIGFMLILGVLVALLFFRQEARDQAALELVEKVLKDCDRGKVEASICAKAEDVEKDVKSTPVPVPGLPGEDGTDGVDGKDGRDGSDGKDGRDGTDGADGVDGEDGSNGINGINGFNGLSAYEVAVENGYQGTQEEWLNSLKAVDGKDGKDGQDGADAWPFKFVFTFETRSGRTFDCPIEIGEDGQQANQAMCQPREEPVSN